MEFYLLFFAVMLLGSVPCWWNTDDTDFADLHGWVRIIHIIHDQKISEYLLNPCNLCSKQINTQTPQIH